MPTTTQKRPRLPRYADDAEYIRDEVRWIRQRLEMLQAKRTQRELVRQFPVTPGEQRRESVRLSLFAWGRRLSEAHRSERTWRYEIDHRLNTGRMGRKWLSLDQLQRDFGLTDEDRTVLLLAAAPRLQRELEPLYDDLGRRALSGRLTPEVLFAFLGAFDEDRIRLRSRFASDAPLVANALIHVSPGLSPAHPDLLDAELSLTERGLSGVLGAPLAAQT